MYKFCVNRGKFRNIVKIGSMCNMHHWRREMDAPGKIGPYSMQNSPRNSNPPAKFIWIRTCLSTYILDEWMTYTFDNLPRMFSFNVNFSLLFSSLHRHVKSCTCIEEVSFPLTVCSNCCSFMVDYVIVTAADCGIADKQ